MTVEDFRRASLEEFGLPGDREDPSYPSSVMDRMFNRGHRWLAARCRLYRDPKTYTLPLGSSGLSLVTLGEEVIQVIRQTVEILYDGRWTYVDFSEETYARQDLGSIRDGQNGQPLYAWVTEGLSTAAGRVLAMFPGSDQAVASGVALNAYVYPSVITDGTARPYFSEAEHDRLLPRICYYMALREQSFGRADAVRVQHWLAESERQADELKLIIERARAGGSQRIAVDPADMWT